ncbi:MAG: glycosyltransferase family 2 protein [Armatimonadota bacterium]
MSDAPLLSVVIVSWNVREDLKECLQSLLKTGDCGLETGEQGLSVEVIVVDNASMDGTVETVRREFPQVRLIANSENLGYTKANNIGIKESRGKYILLLNPDTIVKPNALRALVDCAEAHPDAGIVGAKLLNPDGSIQRSARSFPDMGAGLFRNTFLGRLFPNNPFVRRYLMTDFGYDKVREVDWVSGAAMLVRRELFERIGLLDEKFWAYCEDVDLCWRAWQAGFKVLFCPDAVILHKIGRSSDQRLVPSLIQHHKSMWLFYLKNYRKRYPLILLPLIGLGILARLSGALLRVFFHQLRIYCFQKLSMFSRRPSALAIPKDDPSNTQTREL